MNVPGIDYAIKYNGRDITADISDYIGSLTYTDNLEGQSDEIQIQLDDSTNVWQNAWYPNKGAILELRIGVMDCGKFEIDEFTSSGGANQPNIFSIKALAAGKNSPIRTEKSYIHEKKSLKQIFEKYAADYSYQLDGIVEDIQFERLVQNRMSDLGFMATLADKYGHIFNIRGQTITLTEQIGFETLPPKYTLTKADYDWYSFKDKTEGTYSQAQLKTTDPTTGKDWESSIQFNSFINMVNQTAGGQQVAGNFDPDLLTVYDNAENQTQADRLVKSALYRKNSEFRTGTIGMQGNERYVAGLVLNIQGIGLFSGNYIATSSHHTINKNAGYRTEIEIKHSNFTEVVNEPEITDTNLPGN